MTKDLNLKSHKEKIHTISKEIQKSKIEKMIEEEEEEKQRRKMVRVLKEEQ